MKKLIILFMAVAIVSSCGGEEKTEKGSKVKPAAGLEKADRKNSSESMRIAYVDIDSLSKKYQPYAQKIKKISEEGARIEQTKASAEQNLNKKYQQQMSPINQQLQSGKININEAQQKAAQVEASLQSEAQNVTAKYQNDFSDVNKRASEASDNFLKEVQNFLKEYNKDNKYSIVFVKSSMNLNILYADEGYDITDEVLKGLNAKK